MFLVIEQEDLADFKPATVQDLMAKFLSTAARPQARSTADDFGMEWDDVVDLTPEQVDEFMAGCSQQTIDGLHVFAEHGPVIAANLLDQAGIDNYGHFQGRVTKRTRTVTGDRHAFLFSWDDWQNEENSARGYGRYAVTETTWKALRGYFGLG